MKKSASGILRGNIAEEEAALRAQLEAAQAPKAERVHINNPDDDVDFNMETDGITCKVFRNLPPAVLYEHALKEKGTVITSAGALSVRSGAKTGRSPSDKRVVDEPSCNQNVWWGPVNIKMNEEGFMYNRERAIDYLNSKDNVFVFDGFAGWHPDHRIKVRVVTERAYHALFMNNMLIRPTPEELATFGTPDYTIFNAGKFPCNKHAPGMTSSTSVSIHFARGEFVILGTQYAGEMKKGVFTIMNYLMPLKGVLSLHSSCNEGENGDVSLFFGLSGTGKTTLSADPARSLIGDDEHCWAEDGVFNIEGGCYAKCIGLTWEKEPALYDAIRFGTVVENCGIDEHTREIDYDDNGITENTRASYPIEYIGNSKIPCMAGHPSNVVLLTCDAFGVLPPVCKLTSEQTMYHFISGYTAKVAGTEDGVKEPQAAFSACFGAPFIVWHPTKYAEMLADKLEHHSCNAWLINTGWTGGAYGSGSRMSLKHTRAMVDAIHNGSLNGVEYETMPVFGLQIPKSVPGVPDDILRPWLTWSDRAAYDAQLNKLAQLFNENFQQYASQASDKIIGAGPKL